MNKTYKEFIESHTVAADYKENENKKCESVQMVSVENAEKACKMAQKELAEKLLEMNDMNLAADMLGRIRDEKI